MTVAEPIVPEVPESVPTYSTVQIGVSLLGFGGVECMTVPEQPAVLAPIVLKFQLPSEPADLQTLLLFSPVSLRVVDIGPRAPRLE